MLDQLLATLEITIEAFAVCEIASGWRLTFDPDAAPGAHYVLSGSGTICVPGQGSIPVSQDTLVLLPKGFAHSFEAPGEGGREYRYDQPGNSFAGTTVPRICAGEGERGLVVACGLIQAVFGGSLGLFDRLTHPIVENFATEPLRDRFQELLDELTAPSLGTRALTEAFLKEAVVLLLRRQTRDNNGPLPWLKVFQDARLSGAVASMLDNPGKSYTLEDLAATAGMSRSAFAEHFVATIGRSPIEFLRCVRLYHASRLLVMTELPIKVVAKSVGYESRSYFSRAFRAAYGVDPTEYRNGLSGSIAFPSGRSR